MKDVLLGFATYAAATAAVIGVMIAGFHYLGPPSADRARSFAFIGGGGMMMLGFAVAGLILIVFFTRR